MKNNNRRVIFWIIGGILVLLFFLVLILIQTSEGSPTALNNKYTIEIFHCPSIAKDDAEFDKEVFSILKSTVMPGENPNHFITPVLQVEKSEFGIPIYGMNYIRNSFDSTMYLFEDRKGDEETFNSSSKNQEYTEIKQKLMKSTGIKYDTVAFDWNNNIDEFIIYTGLKSAHDSKKKTWQSLSVLKTHIDGLIAGGKIKANSKIKIYYTCGDVTNGVINKNTEVDPPPAPKEADTDGDGVTDDKDQCPTEKGEVKCAGCKCVEVKTGVKDDDFDGISNDLDKCPKIYGKAKYNGCPIPDSDDDGWNDEIDKCPDIAGEDRGCPVKEIEQSVKLEPDPKVTLSNTKFVFSGIDETNFKEGYKINIIIKLRNGYPRNYFVTSSNCPKDKNEGNTIFNKLGDYTSGLNITFELWKNDTFVKTINGSFNNISLVCKLDGDCGFKQY
jgi:hypothetical protein